MNKSSLQEQLAEAEATIRALQDELAESNRGIVALNMELDERVEARTAELAQANEALRAEVAERRRVERARERLLAEWKRQGEFLKSLIDNAPIGVAVVDRDMRYLVANPAYRSIPGTPETAVVGRTVAEVWTPEIARIVEHFVQQVLQSGELLRLPEYEPPIRGRTWWTVSEIPLRDVAGAVEAVLILTEDVTERKRAEEALQRRSEELEAARLQAEEANQAKDHFLAVLSHELRTPLTPVLAAVQLIQRMPDLSAALKQPLEVIRRNLQLEARLIDDLLDITRIVQGKLVLDHKPISISTVIERAVETVKPDIDARRLCFGMDLCGPLLVNGDASRLQQVIWNLLNNAVKFTPEGGSVEIRCYREGDRLLIEVADSGIGIEPEALNRIFDAFEQGGRAITRQFGGLGLGLAIVKRLVEMHEGSISAHSEGKNRGSAFRVSLPLTSTRLSAEEEKRIHAAPTGCRRILLVEDNGDTAAMMKMLLEGFGYEVETAGDVSQALKAIESRGFDLLISDLGLPDRSGIELMHELRRRSNNIKGIALSGYGREEDLRRSREAGYSVHLTKPVDADYLVETVSRLI